MRRMLNTLFVTTQGAWISQKGENIIVHLSKEESRAFPIHLFESILCFGQVNVTAPAMGFCAEHGVNLAFFTEYGKFIARVQGEVHGNVLLRREQYRIADNETRCVSLVRNILLGKLLNSKIVLQRSLRDHQQEADTEKSFKNTCALLDSYILQIKNLQKTLRYFRYTYNVVRDRAAEGQTMIFVGTKKQASETIKKAAEDCGMPYVNHRWLGGMLTNFGTIKKSIRKLEIIKKMREEGQLDLLTKKEALMLTRKEEKLEFPFKVAK